MEVIKGQSRPATSGISRRGLLLGAGAALALAACTPGPRSSGGASSGETVSDSSELDKLIDLAKQEGQITIYESPTEEPFRAWVEGFTRQYGIRVTTIRQTSNAVHDRWAQETLAGRHDADVIVHSLPLSFADADKRGWLAEYTPTEAAKFPARATIPGKAYPLFVAIVAMGWNPNVISADDIEFIRQNGLDAFRDSRFDDLLAVVPPSVGGPQYASYQRIVTTQASKYGWQFLEDVAARKPAIFSSGVAMAERMVAGEYGATFCLSDGIGGALAVDGAPLEWVYEENPLGGAFMMGVSAMAPHPNAARLFLEWGTTLQAQTELANLNQAVVLHSDWVDERPIAQLPWYKGPKPSDISLEWAFDPDFTAQQAEISRRWNEIFNYSG